MFYWIIQFLHTCVRWLEKRSGWFVLGPRGTSLLTDFKWKLYLLCVCMTHIFKKSVISALCKTIKWPFKGLLFLYEQLLLRLNQSRRPGVKHPRTKCDAGSTRTQSRPSAVRLSLWISNQSPHVLLEPPCFSAALQLLRQLTHSSCNWLGRECESWWVHEGEHAAIQTVPRGR